MASKIVKNKLTANDFGKEDKKKIPELLTIQQKYYDEYFELDYEDFITIFCSIIRKYTGFDIHISFDLYLYGKQEMMIIFTANDEILNKWAIHFKYELQLSPAAIDYNAKKQKKKQYKKMHHLKDQKIPEEMIPLNEPLSPWPTDEFEEEEKVVPFEEYDIDEAVYWPPYIQYDPQKETKYRRYDKKNDDFHKCEKKRTLMSENEEKIEFCDKCSKYRGIDKIRLIYNCLDNYLNFTFMSQNKIMTGKVFKRNHLGYKEKIANNQLLKLAWNPFCFKNCRVAINNIRNFYGESVSFFFLWIQYHLRWLVFPSIIGIILSIMDKYNVVKMQSAEIFGFEFDLDGYDYSLILFTILLTCWLVLYIKVWAQKEVIYSRIWGCNEKNSKNELNEEFRPNAQVELIFSKKIDIDNVLYHKFKVTVSWMALILIVLLVVTFVVALFQLKLYLCTGDDAWDMKVGIFIATINAIQIQIMSWLYSILAKKLNDWEHHYLLSDKTQSLTIKLVLFDFINNYCALFYIAFYKPYNEGCINGDCFTEIGTQIYTVFLIYIATYAMNIAFPIFKRIWGLRKAYSFRKQKSSISQSIPHQVHCEREEEMNFFYNSYLTQFGYVCLFSVAAPLTPLIVFVLVLIGRASNYYSIIELKSIVFVEGATGIGLYNVTLKALLIAGVISNIAIVLFSSHDYTGDIRQRVSLEVIKANFILFAVIVNLLIIFFFFFNWNIMPNWFNYLEQIKDLYYTKFVFHKPKKKKAV